MVLSRQWPPRELAVVVVKVVVQPEWCDRILSVRRAPRTSGFVQTAILALRGGGSRLWPFLATRGPPRLGPHGEQVIKVVVCVCDDGPFSGPFNHCPRNSFWHGPRRGCAVIPLPRRDRVRAF